MKPPRAYAAEIDKLKTLEQRREALEQVPDHIKGIVKVHLTNTFAIRKAKRERHAALQISKGW